MTSSYLTPRAVFLRGTCVLELIFIKWTLDIKIGPMGV